MSKQFYVKETAPLDPTYANYLEEKVLNLTHAFDSECAKLAKLANGMELSGQDDTLFYLQKCVKDYGMHPKIVVDYLNADKDRRKNTKYVDWMDSDTDDEEEPDCQILEEHLSAEPRSPTRSPTPDTDDGYDDAEH